MPETDSKNAPPHVKEPLPLKDVTKLLVKHYGLKEGLYDLSIEFTIGFGPIGPNADALVPGALVGIQRLGLVRVQSASPSTVDAAEVNPPKKQKTKE